MKRKGRDGHDSQRPWLGSDSEEGTEWGEAKTGWREGAPGLSGWGWDDTLSGRSGGRLKAQSLVLSWSLAPSIRPQETEQHC